MTSKTTGCGRAGIALAVVLTVTFTGCGSEAPAETVTQTVTIAGPTTPETPTETPTSTVSGELTWEAVMERARPAVARVSVATCEGPSMGSGFFIDERHVVTAAHVVEDAAQVSVQTETETALPAAVIDWDLSRDVALLRTEPQSDLTPLAMVTEDPRQGSELAVIGFPLWVYSPLMSEGIVSGEGEPVDYGDQVVEPVFVTNAATNGGNSGGPVVNRAGDVIGLVSGGMEWDGTSESRRPVEGVNYIVPAPAFTHLIEEWLSRGTPNPKECDGDEVVDQDEPVEPEDRDPLPVEVLTEHEMAGQFALILHTHGMAINTGQYGTAWEYFTANQREKLGGLDEWSRDVDPSYWMQLLILDIAETSDTAATVSTKLRTEDDLTEGWKCTIFTLDYDFVREDGSWLIDRARSQAEPENCVPTRG